MHYQQKDGDGSLFRNNRKQPESRQPDWTGHALIAGVKHQIAGWEKSTRKGETWYSLRITPWRGEQREELPATKQERQPVEVDTFDDDVPFN